LILLTDLYPEVNRLFLLPYHAAAKNKYWRLGLETEDYEFSQPDKGALEKMKKKLEETGFAVKIGG